MGGRGDDACLLLISWWLAETSVEISNEFRNVVVSSFYRVDTAKPQFFDQSILQGLVRTFNSTLLAGIGADDIDVQLIKRASELCQATVRSFCEACVERNTPCLSL